MAYLLRQANAAVRLTLERALMPLGVTLPQYLVMTMLRAYPGLSGAELARVALLTPQTISLIMRNLQRLHAVERTARAAHGRALPVTLPPPGSELRDAGRARVSAAETRIGAGLRAEDETVIRRWLVALARDLAANDPDPAARIDAEARISPEPSAP